MAQCVIYKHANFDGPSYVLTNSVNDFRGLSQGLPGSNFNDEVSSIRIHSGRWKFFEHIDYQGQGWELGPGDYPQVWNIGIPDNVLSSAQLLSE